jgi:hypothetical protein
VADRQGQSRLVFDLEAEYPDHQWYTRPKVMVFRHEGNQLKAFLSNGKLNTYSLN